MARPPLPEAERRSEVLQLRLTKLDRELLEAGAELAGVVVSDFIRTVALDKARRNALILRGIAPRERGPKVAIWAYTDQWVAGG